ncbi:hypothetical protein [Xanthomonas albilineans]|uniref:hypothetical protein n=1 Tax=Xanthomonas albilineans TaxID=29447 RepID=UPI001E38296B|nr:hypothetical protein [Xanthomonas albilineans]
MKARSSLAAFTFFITLTTGCSMAHSDPHNPAKNPHPVKRYEVIATSYAPGPWDSITGYVHYDVINTKCVPVSPFIGAQNVPVTGIEIPMDRVDDHTWKGYFYRDALRDEDYFNLGLCHWDVTSISVNTIGKGVRFGWGGMLGDLLRGSTGMSYFKRSSYGDNVLVPYGAQVYPFSYPDVNKNKDAYFSVTIAVKEVKS